MKQAIDLPQFEFLGKLGTGGTAEVCKVLTKENKIAALKTILVSDTISTEEFQKLASREQLLLQNINFPGIVKVYEVQTSSPSYICLEYCSGKTLEQYNKIDDLQTALHILSSIAVNLEYLHLRSIVHADLKPDNIFMPEDISIFSSNNLTFTKLSDFSLGKFEHEENSVRAGAGTVGYMAPETITENIVSHKSDLFALGVIAYQLLTGKHPYITDDADPVKINSRIIEEQYRPLTELRDELPDALIQLVSSLLAKEPSKRPSSGWDVCNILKDIGSQYPFEKVLNPKYCINEQEKYELNTQYISNYQSRIDTITDKDNNQLRLVLSDNFNKGNISYKDRQFQFNNNPVTASYLIRTALKKFNSLQYSDKKSLIKLSLYNDTNNLICSLLPHLLYKATITKISLTLAKKFEDENNFSDATKLFILAGKLHEAENSGYQAAMMLKNENNIEMALKLIEKVISFASLLDQKFEVKTLYMVKGDFLKDLGETVKAEKVYNDIIDLYKDKPEDELLAETYKDLGALYKAKKQSQEGINCLNKALDIFKKLNLEFEISNTYNNLGNIYIVTNNYSEALYYFRKALRIQRKLDADERVASTLNNIGTIYAIKNRFHKALHIFQLSLNIQKSIGNKGEIARTLNNIGYCFEMVGDIEKAIEMLEESLRYNKEIDSKREVLINLENLTSIMLKSGQLKNSIAFLKEGISLASELHDQPHIGLFNLFMGAVLFRMGKITDAIKSFNIVEDMLDVIEDDILIAQLNIERAQLSYAINNITKTKEMLNNAYTVSKKINDKTIIIIVLLMRLTIEEDDSLYAEATKIVEDLKLAHEKEVLNSIRINHFLNKNNSNSILNSYEELSKSLESSNTHMNQSSMYITLAKYELQENNIGKAQTLIDKSIQLAKSQSLIFDKFHAYVLQGKLLGKQKEFEKCYNIYKQALEIAKSIFNQLQTDEDKVAFQNKSEFVFLVTEIKKLSQIIGQKKEQI